MVFEHEWFLNTNIFLNTNNLNFTNLNCYAIFSIKNYSCYSCYSCSKNNILRVQKNYYPCSKNNILRVQKKLLFVFKIRNCCAARKRAAQP